MFPSGGAKTNTVLSRGNCKLSNTSNKLSNTDDSTGSDIASSPCSTNSSPDILDQRVSEPSSAIVKSNMSVSGTHISVASKAAPRSAPSSSVYNPDYSVSVSASKVPIPDRPRDTVSRLCNSIILKVNIISLIC